MPSASDTLGALNDFVGPITMEEGTPGQFNKIDVTIVGDLVGTVELQASFDNGSTWLKIKEYTDEVYEVVDAIELGMQFQLKVTAYTSDDSVGRLGYGQAYP